MWIFPTISVDHFAEIKSFKCFFVCLRPGSSLQFGKRMKKEHDTNPKRLKHAKAMRRRLQVSAGHCNCQSPLKPFASFSSCWCGALKHDGDKVTQDFLFFDLQVTPEKKRHFGHWVLTRCDPGGSPAVGQTVRAWWKDRRAHSKAGGQMSYRSKRICGCSHLDVSRAHLHHQK